METEDVIHEVSITSTEAIEALNRSEVDMQITTAKKYPRDIVRSKKSAIALATMDADVAESCIYALPRGNKTIQGPSVRLAEIIVNSWGNIRAATQIVGNNGSVITARAVCHDLETNVSICIEVQRRIKDKQGRTYNEDMQVMAGNAASAIALRNAVFKVIPGVFTKVVYDEAKRVAVGDAMTMVTRRTNALAWFGKVGVSEEQILTLLDKRNVEEIGLDELAILLGVKSALMNEETTVALVFGDKPEPNAKNQAKSDEALKATLGKTAANKKKYAEKKKQAPTSFTASEEVGFKYGEDEPFFVLQGETVQRNEDGTYGENKIPLADLEKNTKFTAAE